MTPEPSDPDSIDLQVLVDESAQSEAAFVAGVMARVAAVPAHAAPTVGPLWGIWSLSKWLTAAGVALAVLLAAVRVWEVRRDQRGSLTVAESLGVPPELLQSARPDGESR
jgi:hypothetical protein